jgi:hypothetical protein
MAKRSMNFSGMGGKHGRYANSIQGLVDAMRAVGMTDAEIRAELLKLQAEREAKRQAAEQPPAPADD